MFAILLSKEMDPFYENASSFPTAFFTFFLVLSLLFWLISVLGLIDIGVLDLPDLDASGADAGSHSHSSASLPDAVAGVILKLGLNGVPLTVVVTLISIIGWVISYFIVYFFFEYIADGLLRYLVGIPVLLGSLYIAARITAVCIRPLRKLFVSMQQHTDKIILGQVAVVRTSRVDNQFGEALYEDGGAGLILKVRTTGDESFKKGDKVVLFEYRAQENIYRVISEKEFNGDI